MSGFAIFQKINQKLDEGWKMTNVECPICKTIILGHPTTKQLYCVKCEMPVKFEKDNEDYEVEVVGSDPKTSSPEVIQNAPEEEEDFDNMVIQRQLEIKRERNNQLSKKTGELLLQGWTMLEECCEDCLYPYMRSRKGEVVCVGCGPVKSPAEKAAEEQKAALENKKQEEIKKSPVKREEKAETKPALKAASKKVQEESDDSDDSEEVPKKVESQDKRKKAAEPKPAMKKASSESSESSEEDLKKSKKIIDAKKKKVESDDEEEDIKPKHRNVEKEKMKKETKERECKKEKKSKPQYEKEKKKKSDYEHNEDDLSPEFRHNYEVGQFHQSIDFYTKMTELLSKDFDKLSGLGLISNMDKVEEVLAIQRKIDKSKLELIRHLRK